MTLRCPHCGRTLRIPTEKARPEVKVQCPGCRQVFALAQAAPATAQPAPAPQAPAPQAPAPQAPAPQAPAPQAPPHPATPVAPAPAVAAGAAAAGAAARRPVRAARPSSWRTCSRHSGKRSEGVCSECGKGWCSECGKHQGTAIICPDCDALCTSTAEREEAERVARQRRRPLRDELHTVLTYPLRDPMAYIMMAVVVGLFATASRVAAFGGIFGVLFSQGLLYAYSFTAINRVSSGNATNFMPEISDITDLINPVRLGVAAMIISSGPVFVLLLMLGVSSIFALGSLGGGAEEPSYEAAGMPPEVRQMLVDQGMSEEEIAELEEDYAAAPEVSAPAVGGAIGALIALPFALLWKLLYSPIALIAAAISGSFFATLNPVTGVSAIRQMGSVYWEAWFIYTAIALVGGIGAAILGVVPFVGGFLAAFVQSYTFLSFGCLLGFAVYKKAEDLGVD